MVLRTTQELLPKAVRQALTDFEAAVRMHSFKGVCAASEMEELDDAYERAKKKLETAIYAATLPKLTDTGQ